MSYHIEKMRTTVSELLPTSEVFPKHICEMLQSELPNLTEIQLALMEKILTEEQIRLGAL